MISHTPLLLKWVPFEVPQLAGILESWEGTPYRDQIPLRGAAGGCSCFGFVCVILDTLYGRPGKHLVGLPPDVSLHDPELARAAMRWFLTRYPAERIDSDEIQPGDIVVTSPGVAGVPGHVMLVGPRKNTLWHSVDEIGVHYTGMSLPEPGSYHSTYRCSDRGSWLNN